MTSSSTCASVRSDAARGLRCRARRSQSQTLLASAARSELDQPAAPDAGYDLSDYFDPLAACRCRAAPSRCKSRATMLTQVAASRMTSENARRQLDQRRLVQYSNAVVSATSRDGHRRRDRLARVSGARRGQPRKRRDIALSRERCDPNDVHPVIHSIRDCGVPETTPSHESSCCSAASAHRISSAS